VVLLWASGNSGPKAGYDILELSPPFLGHLGPRADPPRGNDALDLGGPVQAVEDFSKELLAFGADLVLDELLVDIATGRLEAPESTFQIGRTH
jgi:hypothetical protein